MASEGLIGDPLDDDGVRVLSVLGNLWGKKWFAGAALKGVKGTKERMMLLLFPDYGKIDRFVLGAFLNNQSGKKVSAEVLRYRAKKAFNVGIDLQRIRKIRQNAYDIKRGKRTLAIGKLKINYADFF
jgi:hypothetical protein